MTTQLEGIDLVRTVIEKVRASGFKDVFGSRRIMGNPEPKPLAPEVLDQVRLDGDLPLTPCMKEWLAFDGTLFGWIHRSGAPSGERLGALAAERLAEMGGMFEVFEGKLPRLCYALPFGDMEYLHFVYPSKPDSTGELPVLSAEVENQHVLVSYPGIDAFLGHHAGLLEKGWHKRFRSRFKVFRTQVELRVKEMEKDDTSHFLIYRVLGLTNDEGKLIDVYQNKGRFLYKYAGSFLEEAAKTCFKSAFPDAGALKIRNTQGKRPSTFEIDCVVGTDAIEIKWRDATTDGDHITKEHTRLGVVADAGYTPIRVMFYYPNRDQAIKIQKTLETLYKGANGHYYFGDAAWDYVRERTAVDLKAILERIAGEREGSNVV